MRQRYRQSKSRSQRPNWRHQGTARAESPFLTPDLVDSCFKLVNATGKRRVGDPLRLWRRTSSADVPPAGRRGGETWRGARFRAAALGLMLLGLWTQGSAAGAASDASEFINVERLSARVMVAHWVGMDRWCNLTAIRTTKGLVVID